MPQAADRRVRRTRRILAEALIGLILERGYERITVQDILDRADIGRSTFYAHFRDKEALLLSCFDGLRVELTRDLDAVPQTGQGEPARLAAVIFGHASRHRRVYQALCGRQGGSVVYTHLHALATGTLRDALQPHPATTGPPVPPEVAAEFYASALLGLLTWWVSHDFRPGHDQMTRIYQAMTRNP